MNHQITLGDVSTVDLPHLLTAIERAGVQCMINISSELRPLQNKRNKRAPQIDTELETPATDVIHTPIGELGINKRSLRALTNYGITTAGELATYSKKSLLAIPGFGNNGLAQAVAGLKQKGMRLAK